MISRVPGTRNLRELYKAEVSRSGTSSTTSPLLCSSSVGTLRYLELDKLITQGVIFTLKVCFIKFNHCGIKISGCHWDFSWRKLDSAEQFALVFCLDFHLDQQIVYFCENQVKKWFENSENSSGEVK